jgi:hypothetical protein
MRLDSDDYRESPYTRYLTDNTSVWVWGAFDYADMSIVAPLGTLGEHRSLVADQIRAEIEKRSA